MFRFALILYFLLLTAISFGQKKDSVVINYLEYYRSLAAAEEAVTNARYKEAIIQYERVFSLFPYNNPTDCYVAAQVASFQNDTAACIHFLKKGLCFGLPVETITANPHLQAIFKTMQPNIVDSSQRLYQSSIHREARTQVVALSRRDQQIVSAAGKTGIYQSNGYLLKTLYQPVYDSMLYQITSIIKSSGFPAQKVIGTQAVADSLFKAGPNSTFAYFILIHHCNAWNSIGDLLWNELQKGNITPQMYGAIYEHSGGQDFYDCPVHYFALRECQDKKCEKIIKKYGMKAINEARWNIGLCSYVVMQQKYFSRNQYYKWRSQNTNVKQPYFDFMCDLHFQ